MCNSFCNFVPRAARVTPPIGRTVVLSTQCASGSTQWRPWDAISSPTHLPSPSKPRCVTLNKGSILGSAWWRHGNTTQCTTSDEGHGRAPKKGSRVGRLDLKLDVLIREHGPAKVASRRDVVISLVVWDINNSNCWLAVGSTRAAGLGGVVCLVLLHGLLYFQLYGLCVRRRAGDVIFVHLVTVFASGACVSGEMVRVCVRV
jgi:hypothetical protein